MKKENGMTMDGKLMVVVLFFSFLFWRGGVNITECKKQKIAGVVTNGRRVCEYVGWVGRWR